MASLERRLEAGDAVVPQARLPRLPSLALLASLVLLGGKGAVGVAGAAHHHDHEHHDHGHHDHAHHDHGHDDHGHHDHGHGDHKHHDHGHGDHGGHAHHNHGHHDHGHHDDHGHTEHHGHEAHGAAAHKGHDDHGHGHAEHHVHDHGHGHEHSKGQMQQLVDGVARSVKPADALFWAYASAFGMSALSFVGVGLLVLLNIPRLGAVIEYASLAFAGTVLVADALVHLLPHALEGADHGEMTSVGLAAVAGCMSILAIPEMIEGHHSHGQGTGDEKDHVQAYGYANLVTEMLHNFVDGISLGLAWLASAPAGVSTALAVAVHELPQELGDFMVLRSAGFPVGKLLVWNFVVSLTCVAGVALVHSMGESPAAAAVQKYMTAFTAGSFLALSLNMIFPQVVESIRSHHSKSRSAMAMAKALCLVLSFFAVLILVKIGELESHEHGHAGHDHGHAHGHGGHAHGHGEL